MDSSPAGYDKGPSNQILQRISEFSTLTSGNSIMLAEILQSGVADPWFDVFCFHAKPIFVFRVLTLFFFFFSFFFSVIVL